MIKGCVLSILVYKYGHGYIRILIIEMKHIADVVVPLVSSSSYSANLLLTYRTFTPHCYAYIVKYIK